MSGLQFPDVSFFFQLLESGMNSKVTVLMNKLSKARTAVQAEKEEITRQKTIYGVQGNDRVNKYRKCQQENKT